ncbi:MAG: F0F1 ATP synthase subunit gamma [Elusimicrobia bacterium]|nr:F0F1 ATP synthase subunit gamma [Elusimicrobiota bacterium]
MPSLREIRSKIKSVRSTEQITKAMKMVAAARMRKSQAAIVAARPFAVKMERTVRDLALLEVRSDLAAAREVQIHPLFDRKQGAELLCVAVGRKCRDLVHRIKGQELEIVSELVGVFPKISFVHAELVGQAVLDAYLNKGVSSVTVLYNEFKSVATQKLVTTALLPIPVPEAVSDAVELPDYGFEPHRQELLSALLPRHIKAQLYRILLESQAAELASRMNAMDAASKNAKELREALNLDANRTRQSLITKEIAELVGGAEALAA